MSVLCVIRIFVSILKATLPPSLHAFQLVDDLEVHQYGESLNDWKAKQDRREAEFVIRDCGRTREMSPFVRIQADEVSL